ncbi:HNH endonuclease signature motif containing protein [Streptomyces sp. NBC_00237]|uniref:HNH endonuclease n=1 Tax=Streptomyces sp. NBC_00237 TaxID=2975687 RepID=UPI00338DECDC
MRCRCALCRVDHVQPLTLGGSDTDGNVQPFCRPCHRLKACKEFAGGSTHFK